VGRFNQQAVREQQVAIRTLRRNTVQSQPQTSRAGLGSTVVSDLRARRQEYDTRLGQIQQELGSSDPNLNTTRLFREQEKLKNARAKVDVALQAAEGNPDFGSKGSEQRLLLQATNPGIKRSQITQIQDPEAARVSANRAQALASQGYSAEQIRNLSPQQQITILSPDPRAAAIAQREKFLASGQSRVKTASVAAPTLGISGSQETAQAVVSRTSLSRPKGIPESISDRNISYLSQGRQGYETKEERELTALITRVQERERQQAERVQRAEDVFQAVPFLRSSSTPDAQPKREYAKEVGRKVLALPATLPLFVATLPANVVDRGRVIAQSYKVQPEFTRGQLSSAVREVPAEVGRTFDPRQPSGLVNLGLLAVGGSAAVRGARRAPVNTGEVVSVQRFSQTPARTLVTERVELGGGFNRALNRLATRSTRITEEGVVRVTTVSDPLLGKSARITDTFKLGDNTFRRTISTKKGPRVYEKLPLRTSRTKQSLVLRLEDQPKVLRQSFVENLQKNIVKQEKSAKESGVYSLTLEESKISKPAGESILVKSRTFFGRGFSLKRKVSVSELGPTSITTRTRFGDLTTQETGAAISREYYQRELRAGKGTSPEQRARYNRKPSVDLDLDRIEQTSIVARTPEPRITYSESFRAEFESVRARGGRSLGRRGSSQLIGSDPLSQFQKTIQTPREVRALSPPKFGEVRTSLPRAIYKSSSRSALAILAANKYATSQASSLVQETSPASTARYSFDVSLSQPQKQSTQQRLVSEQFYGRSGSRTALSQQLAETPLSTRQTLATPTRPLGTAFGLPRLPFGKAYGGRLGGRGGVKRSYAPSRSLFELTFSKELGRLAKSSPKGFTGLEFERSYNPKRKKSRRKR
jgi:hypothetical protein